MYFVRETSPNVFTNLGLNEAITVSANGEADVRHPPQVWQSWSLEDQEAVGIFRIAPFVAPPGTQTVGPPRIERINGIVAEVYDTVDLPPVSKPPALVAAAFNIMIENGDVAGVEGSFNIIGAFYLDVGLYMLVFTNALPDANYFALITGDSPSKRMTEAYPDSFMIECKDGPDGSGIDPANLSVQIMRIDQ